MRTTSRIIYGPKCYFPVLGEEGGAQRLHLGYWVNPIGVYFSFRLRPGKWIRLGWRRRG